MRTLYVRGQAICVAEDRPYWLRYWDSVERGEWEPDAYDALDKFLTPDSCFVDVGAWVGPLTLYAAQKCRWVYAAEPDPVARETLLENVRLNGLRNVTVDDCAIADADGTAVLGNRHELGNSESSLLWHAHRSLPVRTRTLSSFWSHHGVYYCGLLKIDVEGGEGIILPEAAPFIKALGVPLHLSLHGEWVPASRHRAMREAMAALGAHYDPAFRGSVLL